MKDVINIYSSKMGMSSRAKQTKQIHRPRKEKFKMSRVNLADAGKYTGGGGSFFKLEDGEKKNVRFLYNTVQEVMESGNRHEVHC